MSTVLILSVLLALAVLSTVWFWYGCQRYEEEIWYLEDIILNVADNLNGTVLNDCTCTMCHEEAALIREWREEQDTTID